MWTITKKLRDQNFFLFLKRISTTQYCNVSCTYYAICTAWWRILNRTVVNITTTECIHSPSHQIMFFKFFCFFLNQLTGGVTSMAPRAGTIWAVYKNISNTLCKLYKYKYRCFHSSSINYAYFWQLTDCTMCVMRCQLYDSNMFHHLGTSFPVHSCNLRQHSEKKKKCKMLIATFLYN